MKIKNKRRNKRSLFYKKRKLKINKIIISSLLFLTVLMVGFYIINMRRSISSAEDKNGIATAKANSEMNSKKVLNEELNNQSQESEAREEEILSPEEIKVVKNAIKNDKKELLKLVNKEYHLNEDYYPDNLVIPNINLQHSPSDEQSSVRKEMVEDLEALFIDAQKEGYEIFLNSGFRSYTLQTYLYNTDLNNKGTTSSEFVAEPGASEHQLGYAVDITSTKVDFMLVQAFEDTPEGQWLINNAYKYGFILRYGKDKEAITGYKYEPWHYRYIGNRAISKICYEKNLTLEELYELVENK